jgi:hypothetical protein
MGRDQAYRLIDEAPKGSMFYRFILSPDPKREDIRRDLHLREVTEHTMQTLRERLKQEVQCACGGSGEEKTSSPRLPGNAPESNRSSLISAQTA